MSLKEFQSAIANSKSPPKGIKVSPDLWKELKAAGVIEMKDVAAWGVFDMGFQMPFYNSCCLIYDPELEYSGKSFELPPNAM